MSVASGVVLATGDTKMMTDDVPDLKLLSGSSRDPDILKTTCGQKQLKAYTTCPCTGGGPTVGTSRERNEDVSAAERDFR